jgi:hypothetical protein
MNLKLKTIGATAGVCVAALAVSAPARADETVVICEESLEAPPAAVACAGLGVIVHELFVAERPFGPNGALMQVLMAPGNIIVGNIEAARQESGELAKVLRTISGISIRDIERHGIFGGPNSILRKPFG